MPAKTKNMLMVTAIATIVALAVVYAANNVPAVKNLTR